MTNLNVHFECRRCVEPLYTSITIQLLLLYCGDSTSRTVGEGLEIVHF